MSAAEDVPDGVLAKLVCPVTRQPLDYDRERDLLLSDAAGMAFRVEDGVPVLIADRARPT